MHVVINSSDFFLKEIPEQNEDEDEPYEIIETPGASGKDLLSELISMDLIHRTPLQQIGIGGLSGWLAFNDICNSLLVDLLTSLLSKS